VGAWKKKNVYINKNFTVYFTHLPRSPLGGICIEFCKIGPLADVINRAKFYLNLIRGFDSVVGSNFWFPHRKEKSPLTQGLNYCSACDSEFLRLSNLWYNCYSYSPLHNMTVSWVKKLSFSTVQTLMPAL